MKSRETRAALIVLGLVLAACGGDRANPETAAETEDRDSLIEPMTDAIDDAKAVEGKLMEHKDAVDQALEDADDPPSGE
jgi:hypothetical protein